MKILKVRGTWEDDREKFPLRTFRTTNHKLTIEIRIRRKINRDLRICQVCQGRGLDDEFHYFFECSSFVNERRIYIESIYRNRPNVVKYSNLMSSENVSVLSKLCKFIRIVNKRVCPLGWTTCVYHLPFMCNYVIYTMNNLCIFVNWIWEIKIYIVLI